MNRFVFLCVASLIAMATLAFGQEPFPIPEGDPLQLFVELVKNWSTLGPLGIGMAVVVILVQALKKFATDFKYTRLAVAVLSTIYGTILTVVQGQSWVEAAIYALIAGGGAVAIYEAWKGTKSLVAGAVVKGVK